MVQTTAELRREIFHYIAILNTIALFFIGGLCYWCYDQNTKMYEQNLKLLERLGSIETRLVSIETVMKVKHIAITDLPINDPGT